MAPSPHKRQLNKFYQNHRRYVQSRSDSQLRGDSSPEVSSCDPLESWGGKTLYPCGLIANSVFNDTFTGSVCTSPDVNTCTELTDKNWDRNGIAWPSDLDEKFKVGLFMDYFVISTIFRPQVPF